MPTTNGSEPSDLPLDTKQHAVSNMAGDGPIPPRRKRPKLYVPSDTESGDDDTPTLILATVQSKRVHQALASNPDQPNAPKRVAQPRKAAHDKFSSREVRKMGPPRDSAFREEGEQSRATRAPEGFPDTHAEEQLSPRPGNTKHAGPGSAKATISKSASKRPADEQLLEDLASASKGRAGQSAKCKMAQLAGGDSEVPMKSLYSTTEAQPRPVKRKRSGTSDRDPRQSAEKRAHLETDRGGAKPVDVHNQTRQ